MNSQDHAYQSVLRTPYERADYPPADDSLNNLIGNWEHYQDRLILFLGAGASIGARDKTGCPLPSAYDLRNELWLKFMENEETRQNFDLNQIALMSLDHTAALIEAKGDRNSLVRYLADRFSTDYPLWQHAVLHFLKPKAVFTTNYDSLIEKGWRCSDGDRLTGELTPVFGTDDGVNHRHIPLYKPHGSAEYPDRSVTKGGIVISQFDYFDMLTARRKMLEEFTQQLRDYCVLFIGYSFQDMDIAAHLYQIRKENRGPRWYAVFPRNDAEVRGMYRERYGINQINRRFHDFLADLDERIGFITDEKWKFRNLPQLVAEGKVAGPALG